MPRLHHVGVATHDAAATAAQYRDALGLSVVHEEALADRELRVAYLGPGPYVELLEPIDGTASGDREDTDDPDREGTDGPDGDSTDGPVARFLERSGPGLHHLAVAVPDIEAALDVARAAGIEPIDEAPRAGAWGHEVAFVHPDGLGGVLVELVQD